MSVVLPSHGTLQLQNNQKPGTKLHINREWCNPPPTHTQIMDPVATYPSNFLCDQSNLWPERIFFRTHPSKERQKSPYAADRFCFIFIFMFILYGSHFESTVLGQRGASVLLIYMPTHWCFVCFNSVFYCCLAQDILYLVIFFWGGEWYKTQAISMFHEGTFINYFQKATLNSC